MSCNVSLFVFLASIEAEFESQSHFLWHTLRHTHERRMRLRGSSVVTQVRTDNHWVPMGEYCSLNGQEARNKRLVGGISTSLNMTGT